MTEKQTSEASSALRQSPTNQSYAGCDGSRSLPSEITEAANALVEHAYRVGCGAIEHTPATRRATELRSALESAISRALSEREERATKAASEVIRLHARISYLEEQEQRVAAAIPHWHGVTCGPDEAIRALVSRHALMEQSRDVAIAAAKTARESGRRAREALRGLAQTMSALDGKPCWCPGEPHDPECEAARAVLAESEADESSSKG